MKIIKLKSNYKEYTIFRNIVGTLLMIFVLYGCSESSIGQQPLDNINPATPMNAVVKNLIGGAIITYDIPE